MAEVKVTLSDEMVRLLENLETAQQKVTLAAEHITAASQALAKLGLKQDDVAAIIASQAGTSKTAVLKILQTMRAGNLDAYEIVAMFISKKESIGVQNVRRVLHSLDTLVIQLRPNAQE